MQENLATIIETIADSVGDRPVLIQGERRRTWPDLDAQAARLAAALASRGVGQGARVALSLRNCIEYVETVFAVLKLRATPVNVNYRYKAGEVRHVLDDSASAGFVFGADVAEEALAAWRTSGRTGPLVSVGGTVDDGDVADYDALVAGHDPQPRSPRGDDEWLLYTGGTTGHPKAVVARHAVAYKNAGNVVAAVFTERGMAMPQSLQEVPGTIRALGAHGPPLVNLIAPPLMHGTGIYNCIGTLFAGGVIVLPESRSYNPHEVAALIERHRVTHLPIVGDVFARPLADALDEARERGEPYDLSSLVKVSNVGVTWSAEVKAQLLEHGDMTLVDMIAATEGGPFALMFTRRGERATTSRFRLAPNARLLGHDDRDVEPGSATVGVLAAPVDEHSHYLGDPARTQATFRTIDGQRYVVPGDLATLEADGTLVLRGRGSRVVNTGGEKVFAEEVEDTIASHPEVRDVAVVGTPDERFGHAVTALVVSSAPGAVTVEAIDEHVRQRLAGYKRPRYVRFVDQIKRSPAGKLDLAWLQERATD
jgi:3-oxocholest-4-en-26-oate---CoA ligase